MSEDSHIYEPLACRVGYRTSVELFRLGSEYIRAHTEDGRFVGDLGVLVATSDLANYLNEGLRFLNGRS